MATIAPFKGVTYNFKRFKDFSSLVAPPYDVITRDEQDEYYQANPYNVIRLILSKKKTGDSDWDNRYTRSADHFKRWQSEGVLIRADRPCMYLTALTHAPGGGAPERTRWGLISLVRIEEDDSRVILPHERTFSAHKDDRLRLMRACNGQFSQVFGLFEEPDNSIMEACRDSAGPSPKVAFRFRDGTEHRMWVLQDPSLFKIVADAMAGRPVFIADGHHRYETARNYRNLMRSRYGFRPAGRSYEYMMFYLSNMLDEGLTILPSHRLIKSVPGFHVGAFLDKAGKYFHIETFPFKGPNILADCAELTRVLAEAGHRRATIGFLEHDSLQCYLLSLKQAVIGQMGDDLHPSLKKLDVLILSRLILQKALGFTKDDLDNEEIFHYQSIMVKAVSQVQSGTYQMAFLLNPTRIEHVQEVAGNLLVMPRKSTFFYPKVLTGLVFNMIDPYEIIQAP